MIALNIMSKATDAIVWLFNRISKQFKEPYDKLIQWFPIIEKYSAAKYALFPIVIAMLSGLRTILKYVVTETASYSSYFWEECTSYSLSEQTITASLIVLLVGSRITLQLWNSKKKKQIT